VWVAGAHLQQTDEHKHTHTGRAQRGRAQRGRAQRGRAQRGRAQRGRAQACIHAQKQTQTGRQGKHRHTRQTGIHKYRQTETPR